MNESANFRINSASFLFPSVDPLFATTSLSCHSRTLSETCEAQMSNSSLLVSLSTYFWPTINVLLAKSMTLTLLEDIVTHYEPIQDNPYHYHWVLISHFIQWKWWTRLFRWLRTTCLKSHFIYSASRSSLLVFHRSASVTTRCLLGIGAPHPSSVLPAHSSSCLQ